MTSGRKYVKKASGETVSFDRNKIIRTCIRAGASKSAAKKIAKYIYLNLKPGITTSEIYKMVLRELATEDVAIKHRYRLKESIMFMGPAGFAFEKYVAKILESYDFDIKQQGITLQGDCVEHEIDVVATDQNNKWFLIECKYHNHRGIQTRLKDALYTHARFLDLDKKFDKEMIVTNTKLSGDARTYSNCINQGVISWNYPEGRGLETMIERKGLYPVTILRLRRDELEIFSKHDIMLTGDLLSSDIDKLARKSGMSFTRLHRLQSIAKRIQKVT